VDGSDQPLAYTEIFVDVAFADVVRNIGFVQTAVYAMIERAHDLRIADVTQEIEAVSADANIASRLAVAPGSPVLLVQRRYFAEGGRLVEIAMNAHPGGSFRYEMSLQRR
jgi:DNA-binding GntR family transcriptional regulator